VAQGALTLLLLGARGHATGALAAPPGDGTRTPAPRLEALAWNDSLFPPVFLPADPAWVRRSFPPDTLVNAVRPRLTATYASGPAAIDGDLDDWHLVRWNDIGGARSVVRGERTGADDMGLQFALRWSTEGLLLGARLPERGAAGAARLDSDLQRTSVLLSVASSSPVVQRYWMGSARTLRARLDGRIEAWSDMRNVRPQLFDATALGARAAVRRRPATGGRRGRIDVEFLMPFDMLFPALPTPSDTLLCNVLVEVRDAGPGRLAAWATRQEGKRALSAWARLELSGGPDPGTWLVSQGSAHAEGICEWSVVPWGGVDGAAATGRVGLEVRGRDASHGSWTPARARLAWGPGIVRLHDLPRAAGVWPVDRRFEVEIGGRGGAPWRRSDLRLTPVDSEFESAAAEVEARRELAPRAAFPTVEDIRVRLDRARAETAALGEWRARRFHSTGILALRAGAWATVERWLEQAEAQHEVLALGPDSSAARQRLAALWPERTPGGVPVGRVVLRGYRSIVDDSVQPYALYVSRRYAQAPRAPLVVALHDLDQNELSLFEATPLAAQAEARGWIALCPFGRGGAGFQQAGERDVLDALARVRAELPVDGRRLYLTGTSMGGTAAWLLGLRHPDLFAAACVVSGYGDLDQRSILAALGYAPAERDYFLAHNPASLLGAGLATAYRIVHAEHDPVVPVGHARFMDVRLKVLDVPHATVIDPSAEHGTNLMARDMPASLDFLARHLRAEDGMANPDLFRGAGGPVADVFARGPFAIVYGTRAPGVGAADSLVARQVAQEWQELFAGQAYVIPDSSLPAVLGRGANLVLVGDPQSNAVLGRWAGSLPVRYTATGFEVQGRSFSYPADGILFAAPNPEFPEHTVVVLSGMGGRLGGTTKSLLKLGADYAVIESEKHSIGIGSFPKSR